MDNRVVVAEDEPITRMDICEMLTGAGYSVVGQVPNGLEAIEVCRRLRPNLVIMDIKMPMLDGIEASQILVKENVADSIIILTAYSGREFINKVKEIGVMGYIVKPIDEVRLIPQVEIAIAKGKEIRSIKKNLNTIKITCTAKEILMERYRITENEAYRKLRKMSMDRQLTILDMSINIIDNTKK
ncbi:response regulator NasT [Clostridium acetobutylicum]|uniref:Stage 0 sporulation protein A homolog n=1 Tax=Clostridium acetobutylicum (strain ATCC 824 / DSM 792 / JCM 1419 / IAM 19013 / LMG 5710 / NBRC 13948 / NRRL B-527 / VKM B-1787 / 2291 / W) TaxID=272562 RepID=Q97FL5_CLOAB|nr:MULTISPECIES: ANTAR domain-containing response regulator [Clostridium]AAK80667.1 Response regulator (CheY-like reciever domain and HTH-type DNA-binding domain) [Clostridium acetobutylicum ATCC 824]ADZ21767.1 Response regulator (CheY-like reciever domain and HTH-type DNA-binding domain) [Clostridium acetobutylicum EA 2018]AEI33502.1 response regulator [Clostridium acetobutylicum DSM 1731]AWV78919.1 response regulator [Clostridium acetobutylicum]MBC2395157.1 ANTAR domain-containing response r